MKSMREATPCRAALRRATSSAALEMSVADDVGAEQFVRESDDDTAGAGADVGDAKLGGAAVLSVATSGNS